MQIQETSSEMIDVPKPHVIELFIYIGHQICRTFQMSDNVHNVW